MLKYEQIKEYLREEVLKPSSTRKMPTVRALARQFSVATATVLRALQELEHENVIRRKHGSGIVAVRPDSIDANLADRKAGETLRRVVYASIDYPSENVWRTNLMVEQTLQKYRYLSINCRLQNNTSIADVCDFAAGQENCAGLIIFGTLNMIPPDEWRRIGELPFPVVLLDHQYYGYELPGNCAQFSVDAASGAELAVVYLADSGHSRIGYVRNEPNTEYTELHLKTFGGAMRKRGLEFGSNQVFSGAVRAWDDAMSAARDLIRRNLDRIASEKLTALFFSSTHGAFAAVEELRQAGYRVPEDISVIGEGDVAIFAYASPPLTVTTADYLKMVTGAVAFIDGKRPRNRKVFISQHLVERKSVGKLSSGNERKTVWNSPKQIAGRPEE